MWRVSQILRLSPFSDDVLGLTEARMDFVLEMHAADHPKEFKFIRGGGSAMPEQVNVDWANRLTGKALRAFEDRMIPKLPAHLRRRQRG